MRLEQHGVPLDNGRGGQGSCYPRFSTTALHCASHLSLWAMPSLSQQLFPAHKVQGFFSCCLHFHRLRIQRGRMAAAIVVSKATVVGVNFAVIFKFTTTGEGSNPESILSFFLYRH